MNPLDVVGLSDLMARGQGRPEVTVALIDGPVARNLPEFAGANIRELRGTLTGTCARADTFACMHGTFVAGILCGRRGSVAPAICPGCTLLLRPIFAEAVSDSASMPSASPEELAQAIIETVDAGARVINLSSALSHPSRGGEDKLEEALDYSARRGVIIVAAAGNQGAVGSSAITRHPWVIPVAACNVRGVPLNESNLGSSIGRRGLSAPGEDIESLGADGTPRRLHGTSAAAPFVTGAIALLWSEFPNARASEMKLAVTARRRKTLVPPVLDARLAYSILASAPAGRIVA